MTTKGHNTHTQTKQKQSFLAATYLIMTTTNLVRVNLSEDDELHIGMADNRSTNTPVERAVGKHLTTRDF